MHKGYKYKDITIKRAPKMSDGRKRILSPFMGIKNEKLGTRLEKNICR